jgi:RNA polymerase II subunit A-like phosphatase
VCGSSIKKRTNEEKDDTLQDLQTAATATSSSPNNNSNHHNNHLYDKNNNNNNGTAAASSSSQVTVSGGITMTVSEQEGRQIAQQDSQRLLKQRKLSLVLDLDHTLVHATSDPRARQYCQTAPDVRSLRLPLLEGTGTNTTMLPKNQQQQIMRMYMQHHVKLRPHIIDFLEQVQPMYELTVYTAGTRQYAEEITIVLCRHLVGSQRDVDDLDGLRFQVQVAEAEYKNHLLFLKMKMKTTASTTPPPPPETTAIAATTTTTNGSHTTAAETEEGTPSKKRTAEDMSSSEQDDDDETKTEDGMREPPKKRKKVTFGSPASSSSSEEQQAAAATAGPDTNPTTNNNSNNYWNVENPMTLERLEALRQELRRAEALEQKAWELRQKIFGSRVVSRTDVGDLGRDVKSLKRIFPCGGTMAAVVDDREDVWANAVDNSVATIRGEPPDNLLLVRPYHWRPFVGFADINNAAGVDLSGIGPSSDTSDPSVETDVQLLWTGRILKELHQRYYQQDEGNRKTVPELLAQMRRQVLGGSTLVLSGLVPLHKKTVGANAPRPPIVRYAQSLGSRVSVSRCSSRF